MTSTSSKRPYFNKNIEELSTLVQENKENKKILKQLLHELSFRSRPKAKALAKTVEALLETEAAQEQLTLPLKPQTGSGSNGCTPEPFLRFPDAAPGEVPTPGTTHLQTRSEGGYRELQLTAEPYLPPQSM